MKKSLAQKKVIKKFESEQEMFSFLYKLIHGKSLYKPEIQVFNPSPVGFKDGYIIPRDAFLIVEGVVIERTPKAQFPNVVKSMFNEKNIPAINIMGGSDSSDLKRVTTLVTPKSVCDNTVEMHFIGGFSKEEIRRITEG